MWQLLIELRAYRDFLNMGLFSIFTVQFTQNDRDNVSIETGNMKEELKSPWFVSTRLLEKAQRALSDNAKTQNKNTECLRDPNPGSSIKNPSHYCLRHHRFCLLQQF